MKNYFAAVMRRATLSTRAGNVVEATRIIRDALSGRRSQADGEAVTADANAPDHAAPTVLRLTGPGADRAVTPATSEPAAGPQHAAAPALGARRGPLPQRLRKPLGEVLRALRGARLPMPALGSRPGLGLAALQPRREPEPQPDGAQFLTRSFACAAGGRGYKLYIPSSATNSPRGLIVMLHGCKQDPDDFAAGTNMNAVAETHGLLVAYPGQTSAANISACWNWFSPADQARGAGEPAIIAGLTRELMAQYSLCRDQVFVAGLSAGGAMSAVMGETYPDVFGAVGVHSGLAYRSATDVMSALAVMRANTGGATGAAASGGVRPGHRVRTIVFHGSADATVHPSNAERIVEAANAGGGSSARSDSGLSIGGRACARTLIKDFSGATLVECWLVDGAGHAWSGGKPSGSYTDARGPNASAEMARFFLGTPETAGN